MQIDVVVHPLGPLICLCAETWRDMKIAPAEENWKYHGACHYENPTTKLRLEILKAQGLVNDDELKGFYTWTEIGIKFMRDVVAPNMSIDLENSRIDFW